MGDDDDWVFAKVVASENELRLSSPRVILVRRVVPWLVACLVVAVSITAIVMAWGRFDTPAFIRNHLVAPLVAIGLVIGLWRSTTPLRLSLVSLVITLLAVEGVVRLVYIPMRREVITTHEGPMGTFNPHPRLGYSGIPLAKGRTVKRYHGQTLCSAGYSFDALGRRVTPAPGGRHVGFIAFFGCSFTFGECVEDGETLPAQVARLRPDIAVVNYGLGGYGPQNMLVVAEDVDLRNELPRTPGVFVYTFIDNHVDRAIGRMRVFDAWAYSLPYYAPSDNDRLVFRGSFIVGRPGHTLLYSALSSSRALEFVGFDLPMTLNDDHFDLTTDIIADAKLRLVNRFPGSRFVVVIFPSSLFGEQMTHRLNARGIEVLDYSRLADLNAAANHIPIDLHPSSRLYRLVAEKLALDLGEIGASMPSGATY